MNVARLPLRAIHRLSTAGKAGASYILPKRRAIRVGAANSLCDENRLLGLQRLAETIAKRGLRGDVVECGVYRGGSAVVIGERLLRSSRERQMWLFDVFSGMPEPGPNDPPNAWDDVGKFVSSDAIVRHTFTAAKIPLHRVHIVAGRYEVTLPLFKPIPMVFLHLDCDWYESVKLCLRTLFDVVVPGGAIVFDDYGYWSGCKKAVDEFLVDRSLHVKLTPIDFTSHYFIKP